MRYANRINVSFTKKIPKLWFISEKLLSLPRASELTVNSCEASHSLGQHPYANFSNFELAFYSCTRCSLMFLCISAAGVVLAAWCSMAHVDLNWYFQFQTSFLVNGYHRSVFNAHYFLYDPTLRRSHRCGHWTQKREMLSQSMWHRNNKCQLSTPKRTRRNSQKATIVRLGSPLIANLVFFLPSKTMRLRNRDNCRDEEPLEQYFRKGTLWTVTIDDVQISCLVKSEVLKCA